MKGALLAVVLLFLMTSPAFSDMLEITWGMTEEEVKKMEKGKLEAGVSDGLPYLTHKDSGSTITYEFDQEGSLYQVEHRVTTDKADKLSNYRDVRKTLLNKYGEPNLEIVTPTTNRVEWENGDTTVRLSFEFSESSFHVAYFNTVMYQNVTRFKLLRLVDELEEERSRKSRSLNLEMISLTSE
jgi:hypothetical protein